jgi:hypothetical protein
LIFPNKVSFKAFVDNLKNNCISIEIHSYFVYFFIHSAKVSFSSTKGKEKRILIWNSLESRIFIIFIVIQYSIPTLRHSFLYNIKVVSLFIRVSLVQYILYITM